MLLKLLFSNLILCHVVLSQRGPGIVTRNEDEFTSATGFTMDLLQPDEDGKQSRNSMSLRSMLQVMACGKLSKGQRCTAKREHFLNALLDYGCNCFPSNTAAPGFGPAHKKTWYHMAFNGKPIDKLDEACLKVYNSYKCMFMDYESGAIEQRGNGGCYTGMTYTYHFDANSNVVCGPKSNVNYANRPGEDCRLASCKIERDFANTVLEIMQNDPKQFKLDHSSNYNFCPYNNNGGSNGGKDACCGEFPTRYQYNSIVKQCCGNGEISSFGTC